jgi:hypothetical protein
MESELSELEPIEPHRPGPSPEQDPWQLLRSHRQTTFYVWGYGAPHNVGVGGGFRETEAARRFAAERGWDPTREEAWASECRLAMPLSAAIRRCADTLRLDVAAMGWGLRTLDPE